MSNITIKGNGNKTCLVIASSNSSINAGDTIEEYINDIQNYIREFLQNVITIDFIKGKNLEKTNAQEIVHDIELCWVGKKESFYTDISNIHFRRHAPKIFTHFMETTKQVYYIYLQDKAEDILEIKVPINFRDDIFSKIQYVNSKVPDNLKESNPQGLHTLGLLNNTIGFSADETGLSRRETVKEILNREGFGLKKYYGIYAYNQLTSFVGNYYGTFYGTHDGTAAGTADAGADYGTILRYIPDITGNAYITQRNQFLYYFITDDHYIKAYDIAYINAYAIAYKKAYDLINISATRTLTIYTLNTLYDATTLNWITYNSLPKYIATMNVVNSIVMSITSNNSNTITLININCNFNSKYIQLHINNDPLDYFLQPNSANVYYKDTNGAYKPATDDKNRLYNYSYDYKLNG